MIAAEICRERGHATLAAARRGLRADVQRDLAIRFARPGAAASDTLRHRVSSFVSAAVMTMALHRFAHWLDCRGLRALAALTADLNMLLHKVHISPQSCIGDGAFIPHPAGVTFHGVAGRDLTMYSLAVCCPLEDGLGGGAESGPRLGDAVVVGRAMVIGPVSIGDESRIFGARVAASAPARSLLVSRVTRVRIRPADGHRAEEAGR